MSKAILFSSLCIASTLPSVLGTASLIPKLSSAGCTGHLKDLSVTSITCDYDNDGCTFGSSVFVTGQVTADNDLPRPMKVSVSKTLPSVYSVGTKIYSTQVDDLCESGALTAYPDDSGSTQSCPEAGVYNFNFVYENFGSQNSWYAGWSGYSMGMVVHLKHEGGGSDYATCHINVHAQGNSDTSYATNATFVSIATLGLAGVFVGFFVRRRKERLSVGEQSQSEERTKEMATNFELVVDRDSSFV